MLKEMLSIFRLFNIVGLDLYDLKIIGNGHILTREMGKWAQIMPLRIDRAVRAVAQEFTRDCVKSIDKFIYHQPASSDYQRTKKLRKGHTMRRLGEGYYVVENLVPYAWYQHEGWTDRGGNYHIGRPWMDFALIDNQEKYSEMMDDAVNGLWK
jgi:hypothetical protein